MKKHRLLLTAIISSMLFSFTGCQSGVAMVTAAPTVLLASAAKTTPTPTPKPKAKKKKKVTPTPTPKPTAKKPKATPTPKPKATPTPAPKPSKNTDTSILSTGFENTTSGFAGRGGGEIVEATDSTYNSGKYSLKISNRSANWHGAELDMTGTLLPGSTYKVTAWVKYIAGEPTVRIDCKINKNNGASYLSFATTEAEKDTWTKIEGTLLLPKDTTSARFYFEANSQTDDFYVDDVELTEVNAKPSTVKNTGKLEGLAKAYTDYFTIGAATSDFVLSSKFTQNIVLSEFNTITMENEMKPYNLLNFNSNVLNPEKYNTSPALDLNKLDKYLKFAQDNGLKVRFHTLVWHSQTPTWFFKENYSNSPSAKNVSREVMLKRMESYIKQIMEYTSKYPGVIYAWDVVNEAIEPSHKQTNGYRTYDSLWYQVIGEDFVEKAFEYARKYSYDDAGLFYNDYSTENPTKRTAIYNMAKKLKDKGLIDGLGLQSHIDMYSPSISEIETSIKKYSELGLKINITELDMHNNQKTDEAFQNQAIRYGDIFDMLVKLDKEGTADITNVTFWGVLDTQSWLTNFRRETSYPLLFDGLGQPKPCYYEVLDAVQ